MSSFWKVFIGVVVTLAVAGGGTYYYMNQKLEDEKSGLQSQITELNELVKDLQASGIAETTTGSTDDSATTETDETADWKTYTNDEYGFSFKYPGDWDQGQATPENTKNLDPFSLLVFVGPDATKNMEKGGPYGISTIRVYDSLNKANQFYETSATSLSGLLSDLSQKSDPTVTDVASARIGNTNGYVADAGPNVYGGGKYYFVKDTPERIYTIHFFTAHENYDQSKEAQILSTFQFTK